jgi:hypothetical protein
MGYDPHALRKFLFLSLPILVLTMALFRAVQGALGHGDELLRAAAPTLPIWIIVGTWILEAVGLSALFLLIQGAGGNRLINGLLSGWIAWIFRGPLLVVAVVTVGGQPAGPWWSLALSWWLLYTLCGLILGAVGAASRWPSQTGYS